ncbi:hypothetical protein Ae717Ps2_7095 [Pseudonocardia sp. Ae717_Ps2]|nr:hypothetical protein Ae717Ps2_7095 [Pseudonocardia sp. Ae717_Ps2]
MANNEGHNRCDNSGLSSVGGNAKWGRDYRNNARPYCALHHSPHCSMLSRNYQ